MESSHQKTRCKQFREEVCLNHNAVAVLILSLEERTKKLGAKLKMNCRNSSKPPFSGRLNKSSQKSLKKKNGRTGGKKRSHKGKTLELVQNPDQKHELQLKHCPDSDTALDDAQIITTIKRQIFDLPSPKLEVTEYTAHVYSLDNGKQIHAELPKRVDKAAQSSRALRKTLESDIPASNADYLQSLVRLLLWFLDLNSGILLQGEDGGRELNYNLLEHRLWAKRVHLRDRLFQRWSVKNGIFDEKIT